MCYDSEEGSKFKGGRVQFRSKWKSEWSDRPDYGRFLPVSLPKISTLHLSASLTSEINWISGWKKADRFMSDKNNAAPYGDVFTTEGKRTGDVWEIKKEDCHQSKIIRFTFTPKGNNYNQFTLSLKAPFKDFSILNMYEKNIVNNCWIPYSRALINANIILSVKM